MTFMFPPLSGSTSASLFPILLSTVFWFPPNSAFFNQFKCCAVCWKYSGFESLLVYWLDLYGFLHLSPVHLFRFLLLGFWSWSSTWCIAVALLYLFSHNDCNSCQFFFLILYGVLCLPCDRCVGFLPLRFESLRICPLSLLCPGWVFGWCLTFAAL